ncbi:MAG: sulfurtransferase TusA family protein [Actinobacteria bacterium]|nr:sulfurtransferase TusA family protein [Actinomycetota bacterium]
MKEINCTGKRCPLPIIEASKAIKEMKGGESLVLISDDPATRIDLPAWSRMTGNDSHQIAENRYSITKKATN